MLDGLKYDISGYCSIGYLGWVYVNCQWRGQLLKIMVTETRMRMGIVIGIRISWLVDNVFGLLVDTMET